MISMSYELDDIMNHFRLSRRLSDSSWSIGNGAIMRVILPAICQLKIFDQLYSILSITVFDMYWCQIYTVL